MGETLIKMFPQILMNELGWEKMREIEGREGIG